MLTEEIQKDILVLLKDKTRKVTSLKWYLEAKGVRLKYVIRPRK